jgi:hypothetical protein
LVETIDASDSYMYVREGDCGHGVRACFVSLTMAGSRRIMWVKGDTHKTDWDLMGSIGHELRHTIEVISNPSIRSNAAKYFFYDWHARRHRYPRDAGCRRCRQHGPLRSPQVQPAGEIRVVAHPRSSACSVGTDGIALEPHEKGSRFFGTRCQFLPEFPASTGEPGRGIPSMAPGRTEDEVMLKSRVILLASVAAIVGFVGTVSLHAGNDARHTMYLTFSAPVALPGVALPAGTYIFEQPIPEAGNLVRVTSADGAHVYLTAFTRIVERPAHLKSATHVLFAEVPRGMTPPIKVWYPVGASTGHEFIYPKNSRQLGLDN